MVDEPKGLRHYALEKDPDGPDSLKWAPLCQPGYGFWHRHELVRQPYPTCLQCIAIIIRRGKLPEEVEDGVSD